MKTTLLIFLVACTIGCVPERRSPNEVAGSGTSLLDENSLKGWHYYQGRSSDAWEIADGVLHRKPFEEAEAKADLVTDSTYEDFELTFEWKISHQGNSGVLYRVDEKAKEPYFSGPEYQILDDENFPGEVPEFQLTGSCFHMFGPSDKNIVRGPGSWNTSRIVVSGNSVEHWLNNTKVVSYEIGSESWQEAKLRGKWNSVPEYASQKRGHIVLQDHGSEVWFKNITIQSL